MLSFTRTLKAVTKLSLKIERKPFLFFLRSYLQTNWNSHSKLKINTTNWEILEKKYRYTKSNQIFVCLLKGDLIWMSKKFTLYKVKNHTDKEMLFWVTGLRCLISHDAISSASSGRMKGKEISRIISSPQNGHSLPIASSSCDRICKFSSNFTLIQIF